MRNKKVQKIALYGILIALAMILSYVESLIPAFFAVPGMKLGLTNIVVVFALYLLDWKAAIGINFIRIILVSILFGNLMSLAYSLTGGILSCVVMILLKRTGKLKVITVSAVGGVVHNIGQIIVAMIAMGTSMVAWYLLVLWFAGLASGIIIGIISGLLTKRLKVLLDRIR